MASVRERGKYACGGIAWVPFASGAILHLKFASTSRDAAVGQVGWDGARRCVTGVSFNHGGRIKTTSAVVTFIVGFSTLMHVEHFGLAVEEGGAGILTEAELPRKSCFLLFYRESDKYI